MIEYATASLDDVALMFSWAAAEGWNPGIEDAEAFFATDPEGFFVAKLNDEPVASISVVNHSDTFSFLGLYIVRPEYRGRGIGFDLWKHALDHAGTRVVGLDGVPEQQANYAKSGFVHAGSTTRYAGVVPHSTPSEVQQLEKDDDIERAIQWEAEASGIKKENYLRHWFQNTKHRKSLRHSEGMCTVRACAEGAKIGPLLAENETAALELIRAAAGLFDGEVIIDAPSSSLPLHALCRNLGLKPTFETARMYLGKPPSATGGFYAPPTLELG